MKPISRHTLDNLSLRQYGDGALRGPLLLVDRDSLGAPAVTGHPVEGVGQLVDDGGVDELATVVFVDEQDHDLGFDLRRAAVVVRRLRSTRLAPQIGEDLVERVWKLLSRNLQRLVDADSCVTRQTVIQIQ